MPAWWLIVSRAFQKFLKANRLQTLISPSHSLRFNQVAIKNSGVGTAGWWADLKPNAAPISTKILWVSNSSTHWSCGNYHSERLDFIRSENVRIHMWEATKTLGLLLFFLFFIYSKTWSTRHVFHLLHYPSHFSGADQATQHDGETGGRARNTSCSIHLQPTPKAGSATLTLGQIFVESSKKKRRMSIWVALYNTSTKPSGKTHTKKNSS